MTHLAMNEYTTKEWTFEEDVRYYSNAGYEGIGIIREKIRDYDLRTVTQVIRDHHLVVSEVCSISHLVCKDLDNQKHYIEDAIQAIQIAATLQASALIVLAGSEPSLDHVQSIAALQYSIEELLPVAEHHNVRLALEPLHPMYKASLSFLVSLGEALDFINQYRSNHLGVWLDMYHIWWDTNLYENIKRAKNRIFGVHLNDWLLNSSSFYDWGLPGKGIIPLDDILSTITSTGWQGMCSVEVISEGITLKEYPEILKYCSRWYDSINS